MKMPHIHLDHRSASERAWGSTSPKLLHFFNLHFLSHFLICIKCFPSLYLPFPSLVLPKEQHEGFVFVFFKYCLAALVNTVENQHGVWLALPSPVLGFFHSLPCYTIKPLIIFGLFLLILAFVSWACWLPSVRLFLCKHKFCKGIITFHSLCLNIVTKTVGL